MVIFENQFKKILILSPSGNFNIFGNFTLKFNEKQFYSVFMICFEKTFLERIPKLPSGAVPLKTVP